MQSNTKELQKTNSDLLMLLFSAGFDKSRIIIADHELSENFLTLYLEDKHDFKSTLDETLMYKLPVSKFAEIITYEEFNSYAGVKFTRSGRAYSDRIVINEPIKWFNEDATLFLQKEVLDAVLEHILTALVKGGAYA